MSAAPRPVLVGVDGSSGDEVALGWAVGEAASRKVPLRLVCAYRWSMSSAAFPAYGRAPVDDMQSSRAGEAVVARAISRANELDPSVAVEGAAVDGNAVPVLIEESAQAALVVLGSRHLSSSGSVVLGSVSAAVAARASCPAIVLRGPGGAPEEDPAVVVGVDGSEGADALLDFGFEYASRHHTPLRAVFCWHPDILASMMWRAESPAPERTNAWLSEALAGRGERYPDVVVHNAVIRAHPATGLVAESLNQQLLVVGSHGYHALADTLLGSVSQGVLHHAYCPVAVVPTHPR